MSTRINLLKDSEYRRQGAVSGAFILRTTILSVVSFGLLFGLLSGTRFRVAQQDLLASQEIWALRAPMYDQIMAMKQDLAMEKKLRQELKGWQTGRILWTQPLEELRKVVPPTMQLRRLDIRGDLEVQQSVVNVETEAGAGAAPAQTEQIQGKPMRKYSINLDGKASGQMAETVVVQFVRMLPQDPVFAPIFKSVKLQSLQREMIQSGGVADRAFSIEALTPQFEIK